MRPTYAVHIQLEKAMHCDGRPCQESGGQQPSHDVVQHREGVQSSSGTAAVAATDQIVNSRMKEEPESAGKADARFEATENAQFKLSPSKAQELSNPTQIGFELDPASNRTGSRQEQKQLRDAEVPSPKNLLLMVHDPGLSVPHDGRGSFLKTTVLIAIHPHAPDERVWMRVAKLDTGAKVNLISQRVVKECRLTTENYDGQGLQPLGPTAIDPIGLTTFEWHVCQRQRTYRTTFAILKDDDCGDFDIILSEKAIGEIGFYMVNHEVFWLGLGLRRGL